MSQYLVNLRNNFGLTPIVIQQLAFDSENDERHKTGRLTPTLKDFGDSKYTTRDANVIMTLFSPYRYSLERFQGYDVTKLGNSFRNLEILENREQIDLAKHYEQMPKPSLLAIEEFLADEIYFRKPEKE